MPKASRKAPAAAVGGISPRVAGLAAGFAKKLQRTRGAKYGATESERQELHEGMEEHDLPGYDDDMFLESAGAAGGDDEEAVAQVSHPHFNLISVETT